MLATMMTALFFMVRAFGQLGTRLFQEERLPYVAYQPHPWQLQYVTPSRRASRDSERGTRSRQTSTTSRAATRGDVGGRNTPHSSLRSEEASSDPERAALIIQSHYRKYQHHKHHKD
ncbi:hypothetical protein NDU88_006762 [Pleurodeles waltl]|uniref:Secreted protein n=1 Tax=Pleurodeles waltl TaxID=8319 RepID=A0AAV7UQY8_PLEWA|nr:hypothetical protein NDU88_006762 [Pleurodeles waltl]